MGEGAIEDNKKGYGLPSVIDRLSFWIIKEGIIPVNFLRLPKVSLAPASVGRP